MSKQKLTLAAITATGTAVSGPCVAGIIHLAAGVDAATATVRDGGALGPIRAKLSAVAAGNDNIAIDDGFRFTTDMHVTLTGTSPVFTVGIEGPQTNELHPS
jgi:hypothetical protein